MTVRLQLDVMMAGLKAGLKDSDLLMPGSGVAVLTCGPALLQVRALGSNRLVASMPLIFTFPVHARCGGTLARSS